MKRFRVLYAGDSPVGGPANYLLGILKAVRADFLHISPSEILNPRFLKKRFDAIVLSDFSKRRMPLASEKIIHAQIKDGTGLAMVGGWGSFSGPYAGWKNSIIEEILPVSCRLGDDRVNFPGGALIGLKNRHPLFCSVSFRNPPAICGLNAVCVKSQGQLLLSASRIVPGQGRGALKLDKREYPLLVIDRDPGKRIVALATDLAPHWCGGLVDWGPRRVKLPVCRNMHVELGSFYVGLVSSLIRWLARAE
ncbi:MAG TPA: glutamine amidotransferase [Candidatus Omnitrophota bacterium]|nr:glutamine amidotransferase [Candidatus Omnitrophota bacterium]